jgi:hypothetical protein
MSRSLINILGLFEGSCCKIHWGDDKADRRSSRR